MTCSPYLEGVSSRQRCLGPGIRADGMHTNKGGNAVCWYQERGCSSKFDQLAVPNYCKINYNQ
jgi:hypothetical protein